jgi:hypothetical protein
VSLPPLRAQDAAAVHAAQERSEAQADAWKAETRVLRERLQASEKVGAVGDEARHQLTYTRCTH